MPNVLKVFLENGQTKSFKYDSSTTVQVISRICSISLLVFMIMLLWCTLGAKLYRTSQSITTLLESLPFLCQLFHAVHQILQSKLFHHRNSDWTRLRWQTLITDHFSRRTSWTACRPSWAWRPWLTSPWWWSTSRVWRGTSWLSWTLVTLWLRLVKPDMTTRKTKYFMTPIYFYVKHLL